jgi:uncharacterized metal-binding protein
MLKRLFDWTPRDLAYWQSLRQKGLVHFIFMYGVIVTGGLFFLLYGGFTLFGWLRQFRGTPVQQAQVLFLVSKLFFVGLVSLVAGLINSLITWIVEERLYRKYKTL